MDSVRIRNEITWRDALSRARGSSVQLDLSGFDTHLDAIERHERDVRALSDAALLARVTALRASQEQPGHARGRARRALRAGARRRPPRARPASVRRAGGGGPRARPWRRGRDADGRGQDSHGHHAGGAAGARRPRRARADVQRLPGAPRRRVDGTDLPAARPVGRRRAAGHGRREPPARLRRRRHLRHGQGSRLRPPARPAGGRAPATSCIVRGRSRSWTKPTRC